MDMGVDNPLRAWPEGTMHTRILGSFQLEEGGRRIALGGVRQRAVLVSLLLHANEVVPSEQLLMDLWARMPRSAQRILFRRRSHDCGGCFRRVA